MDNHYVVTIDGPSGVGKSTLAKALAKKLGVAYLDTGAMYRTLALYLSMRSLDALDLTNYSDELLVSVLDKLSFSLLNNVLLCNNEFISPKIYNEEIGALSSKLAKLSLVRSTMQAYQQQMAKENSLVADGRDMGSKVFPKALCKIFLDAKPEVRVNRRYQELTSKGDSIDIENLRAKMLERDKNDSTRELDPLIAALDAYKIDSSNLSIEELTEQVYLLVQDKLQLDFTHIDKQGNVCMVDVGNKQISERKAIVQSTVLMKRETLDLLQAHALPKGDVLTTAKIAGILAAKRCAELIPMCHPLAINYADISFKVIENPPSIIVEAEVRTFGKTGVEMEALVACQIATATIYDMCKAVQKDIVITDTYLKHKSGGKSGSVNFGPIKS